MNNAGLSQWSSAGLSRRRFLVGVGAVGSAAFLGGCATSVSSGPMKQTAGAVTIQSNLSSPQAKVAIEALAKSFGARGGSTATVNTVASETFRTQLPSYLTSATPPDTFTWYPGSLLTSYAQKGLLLDVGDVWQTMGNYSDTFRRLSSDGAGHQVFVPTSY
jgi:multiple sugar transport system substrate-binding protein